MSFVTEKFTIVSASVTTFCALQIFFVPLHEKYSLWCDHFIIFQITGIMFQLLV